MKSKVKWVRARKRAATCDKCGGKMEERTTTLRNYSTSKTIKKCADCGHRVVWKRKPAK